MGYRYRRLKRIIDQHERLADPDSVQAEELLLRKLEIDIDEERHRLQSLGICRSRSYRSFIDVLLEVSSTAKAEAALIRKLDVVRDLHDQAEAMTNDLTRRRERRAD